MWCGLSRFDLKFKTVRYFYFYFISSFIYLLHVKENELWSSFKQIPRPCQHMCCLLIFVIFLFGDLNIVVSTIGLAISESLYPFYIQYKCMFLLLDNTYGRSSDSYGMSPDYYGMSPDYYGMSPDIWHDVWFMAYHLTCGMSSDLWHVAWYDMLSDSYFMSPEIPSCIICHYYQSPDFYGISLEISVCIVCHKYQ